MGLWDPFLTLTKYTQIWLLGPNWRIRAKTGQIVEKEHVVRVWWDLGSNSHSALTG